MYKRQVQKRLIGIGVVILIGILLVATLVVSSLIAYVNTLVQDSAPQLEVWLNLADQGLMYLLMPLVFSALFWFFPATDVKFRDVWPAGILTAFLIGASRYLVGFYLQFSSTSEVYGAAGSLVVLLIWLYIVGLCLFFGASFCYSYGCIRQENLMAQTEPSLDLALESETIEVVRRKQ